MSTATGAPAVCDWLPSIIGSLVQCATNWAARLAALVAMLAHAVDLRASMSMALQRRTVVIRTVIAAATADARVCPAHSATALAVLSCTDEWDLPSRISMWKKDTWRETGSRNCTTKRACACAGLRGTQRRGYALLRGSA